MNPSDVSLELIPNQNRTGDLQINVYGILCPACKSKGALQIYVDPKGRFDWTFVCGRDDDKPECPGFYRTAPVEVPDVIPKEIK